MLLRIEIKNLVILWRYYFLFQLFFSKHLNNKQLQAGFLNSIFDLMENIFNKDAFIRYTFFVFIFSEPFHVQYGKLAKYTLIICWCSHCQILSNFSILCMKGLIAFYKCQCLCKYSEIVK